MKKMCLEKKSNIESFIQERIEIRYLLKQHYINYYAVARLGKVFPRLEY